MRVLQRVLCASWLLAAACTSQISTGGGGGGGGGVDAGAPPVTPPPPTALTADDLAKAWSGCMTLDHFNLAKMATAWGSLAASNGQACSSCHGSGLQGFYADRDATGMFNAISTNQAFLVVYFSADVANQKMVVDEGIFQAVSSGQGSFQGHPPFEPTNNAGMIALRSFYNLTLTRQQAKTCDPPRIP
jgi:hypothetical protein